VDDGGSTQEAIRVVEEAGARVVAAGALIDRSGGKIDFEVEAQSLIQLPIAATRKKIARFVAAAASPLNPEAALSAPLHRAN